MVVSFLARIYLLVFCLLFISVALTYKNSKLTITTNKVEVTYDTNIMMIITTFCFIITIIVVAFIIFIQN